MESNKDKAEETTGFMQLMHRWTEVFEYQKLMMLEKIYQDMEERKRAAQKKIEQETRELSMRSEKEPRARVSVPNMEEERSLLTSSVFSSQSRPSFTACSIG
jgi:hypothetical protein